MPDTKQKKVAESTVAPVEAPIISENDASEQVVLTGLEKLLQKSDVLLMLYPKDDRGNFSQSIESKDEITVYNLLKEKRSPHSSLLLLLDTSGGNVYSAVKIIDCLRTKYTDIAIAIPQEAKSSGTMMCFGANKLIMSAISELGPLDKPLLHPDNENAYISALDIVRSIDDTIKTAIDQQQQIASQIHDRFGIRIKTSLELASDHISKLIAPMLSHEDVKIYNQAKRLLAIADQYGTEFLDRYMLKAIKSDKIRDRFIKIIIRQFIWLYPDHAFAIRRSELRDWLFEIEDAEKLDYWEDLWREFEKNIGKGSKIIRFLDS